MNGEIKFWAWACERCGREFALAIAAKLPEPCRGYGCGGADFLKVAEGRTEEEALRSAQKKRGVNL